MSGTRLRDHGLRIGHLEPGAANAVTDVPGVAVGHVTVAARRVGATGRTRRRANRRDGARARSPEHARSCPCRRCRAQRGGRADGLAPGIRVGRDRDSRLPHLDDGSRACVRRRGRRRLCGGSRSGRRERGDPHRRRMRRQLAQRRAHRAGRRSRRRACRGVGVCRTRRRGVRGRRRGNDRFRLEGGHRHRKPHRPRGGRGVGVLVLANFGAQRDLRIDGVPILPTVGDGVDPRPPEAAASPSSQQMRRSVPPRCPVWRDAAALGSPARVRSPITEAGRSSSPSRPRRSWRGCAGTGSSRSRPRSTVCSQPWSRQRRRPW